MTATKKLTFLFIISCHSTDPVTPEVVSKRRGLLARVFGRHRGKKLSNKKKRQDITKHEEDERRRPSKITAFIFACCCVPQMD